MSNKGTLYIVGDSFTQPPAKEDTFKPWFTRLALEMNMRVVNCSGMGTSQDFAVQQLMGLIHLFTPNDKILWLLTNASRFWFFDNRPKLTNINIINIDDEMNQDEQDAVKGYMTQLQRPPLDLLWQDQRLGWLSAQAKQIGMQAPQIVLGFPRVMPNDREMFDLFFTHERLDNLRISKGDMLNNVEAPEMIAYAENNFYESAVWKGYDCRYNHIVKSNHDIMLERILTAFTKDKPVDLITPGWTTKVIDENTIQDPEFIKKELDPFAIKFRLEKLEKMSSTVSWADKSGIADWFKNR